MHLVVTGDLVVSKNICDMEIIDKKLKNVFHNADFHITNLEAPITSDNSGKIDKLGPNIKSYKKLIKKFFKSLGINVVTLANNHIRDYGYKGLKNTIKWLQDNSIKFVGAGKNLDTASQPLILSKGSFNVGIINVAEHEFNLATKERAGANPLDPIQNYYQIKDLRSKVDKTVVIVHGGHEHYEYPSPRMQDTYRFFIDSGADVVVGHHPHCYSGYEDYNDGKIFYSLGNFIFDKKGVKNEKWNYGFILSLKLEKDSIDFEVIPYNQCSKDPVVRQLSNREEKIFEKRINHINNIIKDPERLENKFEKFLERQLKGLSTLFEPYENRYLKGLKVRGLIPSIVSKKKYLRLYNYLLCQSHRDLVHYKLEMETNN
jgi:poly-gamma-glutamate synthesis protein (capsule biosynthesis protein)